MKLQKEKRELVFRKETFTVLFHFWRCLDSQEEFTTTALDEINIGQAYNQYRSAHRLPFPEEIQDIRERYGLSASKMAEVLGFGTNVYRQYEAGEVPSESNARLIQLAADPQRFRSLVELCSSIDDKTKAKLLHKIELLVQEEQAVSISFKWGAYILGSPQPDEYSGYRRPSIEKFATMVAVFSEAMSPWKTKLNKLLFYADFMHFGKTGSSISGMRYDAIQLGPVPHNFQSLYQVLADQQAVKIEYVAYENGSIGERFVPSRPLKSEVLATAEMETIQEVIRRYSKATRQEMIFVSHLEKAWKDNVEQAQPSISYLKYGFELGKD